jgi:hypothetical protein
MNDWYSIWVFLVLLGFWVMQIKCGALNLELGFKKMHHLRHRMNLSGALKRREEIIPNWWE